MNGRIGKAGSVVAVLVVSMVLACAPVLAASRGPGPVSTPGALVMHAGSPAAQGIPTNFIPPLILRDSNLGGTNTVKVGQIILLALKDSFGSDPALGWSVTTIQGGAVQQFGQRVYVQGTDGFVFLPVRPGRSVVTLVDTPPPEMGMPTRIAYLTFLVKL